MGARLRHLSQLELAALLRVGVLVGMLAALGVLSAALHARARVDELMQDAGAAMFAYTRDAETETPRTLLINGARLELLAGSTNDSVTSVLDTFDARCRSVAGGLGQAWLEQRALLDTATPALRAALRGVLRVDDTRGGCIACFDLGGQRLTPAEWTARVRAFLTTGDLADIGGLRVAWARRESGHTSYVAVWSRDRLPLRAMFPRQGDAPGVELPGVPRPRGSERLLSAWQEAEAPMLVSYRSAQSAAELLRQYRAQLTRDAWIVEAERSGASARRRLILRRDHALAAAVIAGDGTGGAVLTLTPLR